jgi:hypothetical protein
MACQTLCQRKTYKEFCERNNFTSNRKGEPNAKNYSTSAETVYKYLILNAAYEEEHKGLDDVKIEAYIMQRCFEAHKAFPDGKGIKRNCILKDKKYAFTSRNEKDIPFELINEILKKNYK